VFCWLFAILAVSRATLADAANKFLSAKADLRDSGEIRSCTWMQYHDTCSRILDVLGKHRAVADLTPDDFRKLRSAFAKGRGPVALAGDIKRARILFRFCDTDGLIDRPCKFGTGFDLPSRKTLRQARAARGPRMFEPHEIRQLLDAAEPHDRERFAETFKQRFDVMQEEVSAKWMHCPMAPGGTARFTTRAKR